VQPGGKLGPRLLQARCGGGFLSKEDRGKLIALARWVGGVSRDAPHQRSKAEGAHRELRERGKPVGEPDAGNRHVRFDERGWKTERLAQPQATASILDSTALNPGYGS
jgi:hypothetical protein